MEEGTWGFKGIGRVYRLFGMGKKVGLMVLRLGGQVGQLYGKVGNKGKVGKLGFKGFYVF